MNKEIKENLTGLMVTLGTDTERKFAWCLRKVNNRPFIYIHKIITKWLINNICYYLHINKNKNIHLRIYK